MNNTQSNLVLAVGFLLTMGGVGGIEHSVDDAGLITGVVISLLGAALAGCGILSHKVAGRM